MTTDQLHRVQFQHLRAGDTIFQRRESRDSAYETVLLGTVASVETYDDSSAVRAVTLDSGTRMTRRSWQNKRLWRQ